MEAYAETVDPRLRGALVKALYRCGIPRAAIALGMHATESELAPLDAIPSADPDLELWYSEALR